MGLNESLLKRSTYMYISVLVYVCAFLFFVYLGLHVYDYKSVENVPVDAINNCSLFDDYSDLTFKGLFLNNEVCIIKNYFGVLTFGIYPIVSLLLNAGFFGIIAGRAISDNGFNFVLIHTLPHSIELIAVVLSAADSMFLGMMISLKFLKIHNDKINYELFLRNFLLYSLIILIAAFFEANISMKI